MKVNSMKLTDKKKMYEQIEKHGENLNKIFNTNYDNITLCKRLRKFENQAHIYSTKYCNGEIGCEDWEFITNDILLKVYRLLNINRSKMKVNIFANGDCRGYALKICDKYIRNNNITIYQDWGGYGILAPDFTPNN